MAEPYFPQPPTNKAAPAAVPYRAPSVRALPVFAPPPVKRPVAAPPAIADRESTGVKDFLAEVLTRLFARIAAIALTLGIVYALIALGQAYGDRIPGAWAGFALLAFVLIGAP